MKRAKLVMAAAVNELLTLTNAAEAPPLVFWGPTPDDRWTKSAHFL